MTRPIHKGFEICQTNFTSTYLIFLQDDLSSQVSVFLFVINNRLGQKDLLFTGIQTQKNT